MAKLNIPVKKSDRSKHYSSVRMQQGRFLVNDSNENAIVLNDDQDLSLIDVIGRCGSPDSGFKVENLDLTGGYIDFKIHHGIIYLGGLLLEMDKMETFRKQKDWLQKKGSDFLIPNKSQLKANDGNRFDMIYIEAWQQQVNESEDSTLFEVALGGSDTTTRIRNMRRIKIFKNTGYQESLSSWLKLKTEWLNLGFGSINKENELVSDNALNVTGGYLGAENQTIRIQITDYDRNANTGNFTWGFDNVSPIYRISVTKAGVIKMITEPKDKFQNMKIGQVVEILPRSAILSNNEYIAEQTGFLSKVSVLYNVDNKTLGIAPITSSGNFYMKIWNRGSDILSPEKIPFRPGKPVVLGNTGLEVSFTGTQFTGPDNLLPNFWVIAARPETPNSRMLKKVISTSIANSGIRRFYAPLGIIHWTIKNNEIQGKIISDSRIKLIYQNESISLSGKINSLKNNQPLKDLIVRAYDKGQVSSDDIICSSVTDNNGGYTLLLSSKDFKLKGRELTGPDIYIRVFSGESLLGESKVKGRTGENIKLDFKLDISKIKPNPKIK